MRPATEVMENEIKNLNFQVSNKTLISNVTAKKMTEISEIKDLVVKQLKVS